MDPATLTAQLKAEALRLGFDLVGIAEARPLDRSFFEGWLASGRAAELGYMKERLDERLDPRRIVPGARSVVALAVNCFAGEEPTRARGQLHVARYARGRDYHLYLRRMTRKLRRRLLDWVPGARVNPSVDTSPVLEKVWAELAGLGWVGRNGLLITRSHGSWVLLATLITDVALVPDAPHPHRCGDCRACLPACPTGALPGDGQVDARLCLANWTIETRGDIPEPLRASVSDRHFGCDLCQEACPWNRFASASTRPDLTPIPLVQLRCSELLAQSDDALSAALVGSPLKRPGLSGLRRNAALGLAAQGDDEARAMATALASHPDPVLRAAAKWSRDKLATHCDPATIEGGQT